MRSRYVVEVVDETLTPTPSLAQPAPSQAVANVPVAPVDSERVGEVVPAQAVGQGEYSSPPRSLHSSPPTSRVSSVPTVPDRGSLPISLRAKLNAHHEIPEVAPEISGPATRFSGPPPDMFEVARPQVERAWQQVALQGAHEQPTVLPPRTPRSKRVAPEPILEITPRTQRLERIERLYSAQSPQGSQRAAGQRGVVPPPPPQSIFSAQESRSQRSGLKRVSGVRKKGHTRAWLITGVILLFLLGSSLAGAAWLQADLRSTQVLAGDFVTNIKSGRLTTAREQSLQLTNKNERYKKLYAAFRPVLSPVLGVAKINHLDQLFRISTAGLQVANEGFAVTDTLSNSSQQFLGKQQGSALDTTASLSGQLETVYSNVSGLQAEIAGLDNPFGWTFIDTLKQQTSKSLPSFRRSLLSGQQFMGALPDLIGTTGRRQFVVLLQNNSELRPTGGFIGSLGVVTIENGKFVDFRVEDVYEADGQLNGFVEPPAELKKSLGEAQWYLRDVNWSADFPTVAEQAGWFLDKTLRIKPDGVIALNLAVAQRLLQVTGPIELVDYNEVITAENLYQRAQLHAEVNFFPGSTQKKDFLSAVSNALFQKLIDDSTEMSALLPALYYSAEESQLFLSSTHPAAASVLTGLGWDGSVRTPECPPPFSVGNCQVDTVMQVEANVGVNKSNQYLKRTIDHSVALEGSVAQHTRRVTLTNTSQSNAWPQGAYKAYFRLYVSPQAAVESVTIDGQNLPLESVDVMQEVGKQVFGFLVNVPVRSTSQIEVKYRVPLDPTWSSYALFEQKQSGTGIVQNGEPTDVVTHRLTIRDGVVKTVAPEPIIEGDSLIFTSNRQTHEFMAVER